MLSLHVWLEKIDGKGEDASPLTEMYPDDSGIVATFDGLGGSGSTVYDWEGSSFTGAWFGSRLSRALFAAWLRAGKQIDGFEISSAISGYAEILKEYLNTAWKTLDKNPSKLRSSMLRPLPSTFSGIYFEPNGKGKFHTWSLNAGDSRSYIFTPEHGLQQVTADDIISPADALGTLFSSTRISNCLSADGKFEIRVRKFETKGPVIFISASDGCFDYVPFPSHFEYILLDQLEQSMSDVEWERRLHSSFRAIAGDDVSLAMLALGWNDFKDLKAAFFNRWNYVRQYFAEPIEEMEEKMRADPENAEIEAERNTLRKGIWEKYRIDYEAILHQVNLTQTI